MGLILVPLTTIQSCKSIDLFLITSIPVNTISLSWSHVVSQRIGIFWLAKCDFVDTSVLLRCCEFVPPVLDYCSPVCRSAAECQSSSAFRVPGVVGGEVFALTRVSFRCVLDVKLLHCCMMYVVNSNSNHICSVRFHLLMSEFDIPGLRLQLIH